MQKTNKSKFLQRLEINIVQLPNTETNTGDNLL